jgi:hypothetical protein
MSSEPITEDETLFESHTGPLESDFDLIKIRKRQELGEKDLVFLTQDAPQILSWAFETGRNIWYNLTREQIKEDPKNDSVGGTSTRILTFNQPPDLVVYYKVIPLSLLTKARDRMMESLEKEAAGGELIKKNELETKVMTMQCMQACFPGTHDFHFYLSVLDSAPCPIYFKIICPHTTTSISFNPPQKEWPMILSEYSKLKEDCAEKVIQSYFKGIKADQAMRQATKIMNQNNLNLFFGTEYRRK